MKASAKAVAEFIRAKRKEKKLSQAEFTKLLFPSKNCSQFISNIERGLCQLPVKSVPALSEITGESEEYIIELMASDYKDGLLRQISTQRPVSEATNQLPLEAII